MAADPVSVDLMGALRAAGFRQTGELTAPSVLSDDAWRRVGGLVRLGMDADGQALYAVCDYVQARNVVLGGVLGAFAVGVVLGMLVASRK
jgi:hypothetical protein